MGAKCCAPPSNANAPDLEPSTSVKEVSDTPIVDKTKDVSNAPPPDTAEGDKEAEAAEAIAAALAAAAASVDGAVKTAVETNRLCKDGGEDLDAELEKDEQMRRETVSEPTPQPTDLNEFDLVEIVGLKSAAAAILNGQRGYIVAWNGESGRWEVMLTDHTVKAVRPQNLVLVDEGLQVGMVVTIRGLQNAPELNGLKGTCAEWLADRGRWNVKLEDGEMKAIKPANLAPALDQQAKPMEEVKTKAKKKFREIDKESGLTEKQKIERKAKALERMGGALQDMNCQQQ